MDICSHSRFITSTWSCNVWRSTGSISVLVASFFSASSISAWSLSMARLKSGFSTGSASRYKYAPISGATQVTTASKYSVASSWCWPRALRNPVYSDALIKTGCSFVIRKGMRCANSRMPYKSSKSAKSPLTLGSYRYKSAPIFSQRSSRFLKSGVSKRKGLFA